MYTQYATQRQSTMYGSMVYIVKKSFYQKYNYKTIVFIYNYSVAEKEL